MTRRVVLTRKHHLPLLAVLAVPFLVGGCGAARSKLEFARPWQIGADAIVRAPTPIHVNPPIVDQGDVPNGPPDARLEERVTLRSEGTDLRSLLLGLSKQTGINIVLDEDVRGTVSAYFNDVPLGRALRQILKPGGFDFRADRDFLHVYKVGLESRYFRIQYFRGERSGESTVNMVDRSSGMNQQGQNGQGGMGGAMGGGGMGGGAMGAGGMNGQQGAGQGVSGGPGGGSQTEVKSKFKVQFWRDLSDELESIIFEGAKQDDLVRSDREDAGRSVSDTIGRALTVNSMSGTILVRASRDALRRVGDYIKLVEETIQRQVVIEMRILEVSLSDGQTFGVETKNLPLLPSDILTNTGFFQADEVPRISSPFGIEDDQGPFRLALGSNGGWQAIVNALGKVGDVHVVSAPRITALHNQKAFVKVVRDRVFFMAQVNPTVITQTSVATQPVQFTPVVVPEGIVVDVTPLIDDSGAVTLEIHPSFSVIFNEKQAPGNQGSQPEVERREFQTTVRVQGSETVVIGGLVTERAVRREHGIPWLMDIPFLGSVFRRTETQVEKAELIVLLTPRVQGMDLSREYVTSLGRLLDAPPPPETEKAEKKSGEAQSAK